MVKALHRAGIEVILDVVYNHTAEGNHLGPTLSFKGIDNPTLLPARRRDPRYYFDYTGTGNSLNAGPPAACCGSSWTRCATGCRRCTSTASASTSPPRSARELHEVDRLSAFFDIIHQDPMLSQVKLIAEPWDVGEGGYQVGNFPVLWAEWNGRYRDAMREFWRGDGGMRRRASPIASPARATSTSTTGRRPYRVDQLRHRARRLHAAPISSRTTRSTTRPTARTTATAPTTTAAGTAASRGRPTTRRSTRCARASSATSSPRCCCRRACRCCSAATRWAARSGGNNNAYCQDNEISWFDWDVPTATEACSSSRAGSSSCARASRSSGARSFFAGQTGDGGLPDVCLVPPRRPAR